MGLIVVLASISLVTLASVDSEYFIKQVGWYVMAFIIIFAGSQISWEWFFTQKWFRYGFYWVSVALLLVPYIQGHEIRGTKSWIVIGNTQFEPSELAKVALIILLAGFFSKKYLAAWQSKNIAVSFLYTFIPTATVAFQPDLGSAMVLFGIWVGFLVMSGINRKRFFIGLAVVALLLIVLWAYFLQPYQRERVTGFLFPEYDPLGVNYNVTQAKIAIGSAGLWGKGFGGGTQTQLGFLPEAHTDFIFAAFVEEWGLFGGVVLMLTYLMFILTIIKTGLRLQRNDLKFVVLGAGLVFLIHFFINIGSNLGVVPVIGISLPFVSYGGSNLLTSSLLISIIQRIKTESH